MKKSITISVPKPCHEDWGKMTATEKGRFCKVCTKEVIDFTQTSDEALIKRLQNGENLCGRFRPSQLNRKMVLERKSRNSFLPYAASFLLPLSILSYQEARAQGGVSLSEKTEISMNIPVHTEKSIVTITGQVTDEWGNPLHDVEVLVLETGKSAWTDFDGNYTLQCPSGSTLAFLHEEKLPHEVTIGTKNSVLHALLKGETEEIEIVVPHILGKIAPEVMIDGEIEVIEEYQNEKEDKDTPIFINGNITDENGEPLPFVTILVKGTDEGAISDIDGNYKISAESNSILEFSYIGYITQNITLSNISNQIDVSMNPDYVLGGFMGIVIINDNHEVVESPLEREAAWDNEQWENQRKRQEYTAKENAFKKVQQERAKEALKKKRSRKRKK
ncbi:MAG: carboxypeptidase-like regulatory domain-containing protein [Flavobacteriaceae bacterium]|nr:carboxypeptidase-like regulatory domain-containing protein [Flavobacteriaceae bacterium]